MTHVTLTVAVVASTLVLCLRPAKAFAVYIAVMFFYPGYLVMTMGTIDISTTRIVVAVLLLKCLANTQLRNNFKWCALDTWVIMYIAAGIMIMGLTRPLSLVVENRGGYVMDVWFAYMVARLCLSDRAAIITAVKWVGIALVPLALLGVLEMLHISQPYAGLERYCPWLPEERVTEMRYGLERAKGPFGHPIMFGTSFVLLLPAIYALRHQRDHWRILAYILSGIAAIGALSSISSAPWMTLILVIFCLAMERYKKLVKPVLIWCAFSCIFIAFASNRPFYHVIVSYANPVGGATWHRAKMIDCAIRDFDKWYLAGFRGQDPGWGRDVGMSHTDLTNEYIMAGVRYGTLGVIAFSGMLVVALQKLIRLYNSSSDRAARSWIWALGSTLVAMMITFMGVSIFSQTQTIFYCFLGMVGSSSNLVPGNIHLPQTLAIDRVTHTPSTSGPPAEPIGTQR